MSAPVERVTVSCFACGKSFEKRKTDAARSKSGRFFCSTRCLRKVGSKPRKRADRECEQCGRQFYPQYAAGDPARFCSKACYDLWQRRSRVERTCETCGKTFDRPPSWETRQAARFCSSTCSATARIKRPLDRMHNGRPAILDKAGYVRVFEPDHPTRMNGGWVFEHRLIVEQNLGRRLRGDEHVHHINGVKDDNRLENLTVMADLDHLNFSGDEYRESLRNMKAELAAYKERFGSLDD